MPGGASDESNTAFLVTSERDNGVQLPLGHIDENLCATSAAKSSREPALTLQLFSDHTLFLSPLLKFATGDFFMLPIPKKQLLLILQLLSVLSTLVSFVLTT